MEITCSKLHTNRERVARAFIGAAREIITTGSNQHNRRKELSPIVTLLQNGNVHDPKIGKGTCGCDRRNERKAPTQTMKLKRSYLRVSQRLKSYGSVSSTNSGRGTLLRVNRDGEGRHFGVFVVNHHLRQSQLLQKAPTCNECNDVGTNAR